MTTATPEDAPPDQEVAEFGFTAGGAAQAMTATAVLQAADGLGLWEALSQAPATAAEVAARLDLVAAGTAVLLRALTSLDVLIRDDAGRYAPTVEVAAYRAMRRHWERLEPAVRHRPTSGLPDYSRVVDVLAEGMAGAAMRISEAIGPVGRILDLGAGAAPHTRAMARTWHGVRVTLIDHPVVLERARRRAELDGVVERFTFIPGDLFTMDYPAGHDVVLLSGVLHLYDDDHCRRLIRRAVGALAPNGRLAIVEPLPDESLDRPPQVTLYAVGLYLRAPEGGVRPFSTYAAWLAEAGLDDVQRHDVTGHQAAVVTARHSA